MSVTKKDPYDTTSTARGSRLAASMKEAGGAPVMVRFKTASELAKLDALITAGIGKSRGDVILNLVALKAQEIKKTD